MVNKEKSYCSENMVDEINTTLDILEFRLHA